MTTVSGEIHSLGGCYGLSVSFDVSTRVAEVPHLFPPLPSWPVWKIGWEHLESDDHIPQVDSDTWWSGDRAVFPTLPGGYVSMDRGSSQSTLHLSHAPSAESLTHPYLSSTAIVANYWLGRMPFHAGSFIIGGRAWGVLGGRNMGKSSLLMWLHQAGVLVLSDDLVVLDGSTAYCGPRCLDLRQGAAERFGGGEFLGMVGNRDRWRVRLPEAPPEVPFGGWVALGWSDTLSLSELPTTSRLAALAANLGLAPPGAPMERLLDLLEFPMISYGRPERWDDVEASNRSLLDRLSALTTS
jgi:hypothetical protein